jgi:transposase
LEVLREESTLNEMTVKYGVSPKIISRWKAKFIENMPTVFDKKNTETEQLIEFGAKLSVSVVNGFVFAEKLA